MAVVIDNKQRSFKTYLFLSLFIFCMKLAYFYEREESLNYQTNPLLKELKALIQGSKWFSCYLPILLISVIEM